jgi:hypothetical protein
LPFAAAMLPALSVLSKNALAAISSGASEIAMMSYCPCAQTISFSFFQYPILPFWPLLLF